MRRCVGFGLTPVSHPLARLACFSLVCLALVAGCSSGAEPDARPGEPGTDGTTRAAPEAADLEAPVAQIEVAASPGPIAVDVLALVRIETGLVLTLDVTVADEGTSGAAAMLAGATRSASRSGGARWVGLRLLDLPADVAAPVARDSEDDPVVSVPDARDDDTGARVQLLFADPGGDTLSLLVPQHGLVEGVPVVDGTSPPAVPTEQDPLDPSTAVSAEPVPLKSFSYDLASTTRVEADAEGVSVALGSDVLFATDSAELSQSARQVVGAAAADLAEREPGTIQVVGHTDDVGDDADNQELSQRRAEAVAAVLGEVVDGDDYPLETSGRGESEPVAENTSASGRAANRRVELLLPTPAEAGEATQAQGAPDPTGPVATGAEGLELDGGRPYLVQAPSARVVDGHLVVELVVTAQDQEVGSVFGPALFEGSFPGPAGLDRLRTMAGLTVLDGARAVAPMLHLSGEEEQTLVPLTDLATFNGIDGGDARRSALVYPADLPVGETVTLQLLDVYTAQDAWRLTDVPVAR